MVNPVDALLILTALLAVTLGVGIVVRWRQGRPQHHVPNEIGRASCRERVYDDV